MTAAQCPGVPSKPVRTPGGDSGTEPPGTAVTDVGEGHQELREVCHDMQHRVAAVRTLADAALADGGLQGAARSYVEKLADQAETLADTIRQQLYPAESDQEWARLTDLRSLIVDAAEAERVTYQGTLEVLAQSEPVLVYAKRNDVRRILSNLLANATRAAGPAGRVVLEVKARSGLAQLVVDNTGAFGEVPDGAGLGWGIMAQRLARCGGRIAYRRGSEGGVRATLSLPLALD